MITVIAVTTLVAGTPDQPMTITAGESVSLEDSEARYWGEHGVAYMADPSMTAAIMDAPIAAIVDAIAELPSSGYGKDGKPTVKAIQAIIDQEVSARQRDLAWQQFQDLRP